jgi:predicted ArsR family transcriptional regulator
VVKLSDRSPDVDIATPDWGAAAERRTRARVCREVLERGPVTAAQLAGELGLTSAAVRRHLDALLADGYVALWERPSTSRRGRGRPARRFVGTDTGHGALSTAYDDLAASVLRFLETSSGSQAVRQFADQRIAELEERYRPVVLDAGGAPADRAAALAGALSEDGYAASTRALQIAGATIGTQLCQGHCPVQHVAREFPQLCEAETEAFSRLLGVHVQRLATLAHGEHVCTTHVPPSRAVPAEVVAAGATEEPGGDRPDDSVHHERTTP